MKAIISNKIYMTVDQEYLRFLEKELSYVIPSYGSQDKSLTMKTLKIINYNLEGGKVLVAFPVGRTDLIPKGYGIVDKRSDNIIPEFPSFLMQLRPSQQEIHDEVSDNCMINAKVGFGKTFTALAIASKLKQKTLIITHTVELRSQWEREVVKTLGIKPGVIGSGKYNINSPVVVANIQSLTKNISEINREFGLVIVDECHRIAAPTFTKVVDAMFARFKIGLSGTLERKDQKHVVFKDYFGSKVFKPEKENTLTPDVHVVVSGLSFPDSSGACWADRVTGLLDSKMYRDMIIALADKYSSEGHSVMIVADRVEFLQDCSARSKFPSEVLTGGVSDREALITRMYEGTSKQLWGTQSIVSEGLSINPLSCLILGTPLNNMPLLEQLIGRVIREHPGKLTPVIIDIKLEGYTVRAQFNNRIGHYMKEGYQIEFIK